MDDSITPLAHADERKDNTLHLSDISSLDFNKGVDVPFSPASQGPADAF